MATRNVVLTPHQEQVIQDLVQSGRYQTASEVMLEGLRLLEQHVAEDAAKIEALRQTISIGIMDLEHGRFTQVNEGDLEHYLEGLRLEATIPRERNTEHAAVSDFQRGARRHC
ncbi:UNVERIFIED_CONTAM: type II toxin-antitoxin system ParD family antitoxin [Pseudomonas sp. JL1]